MKKKLNKQGIFCLVSFLFILGCIIFYGCRLFHYYKKFNPSKRDSNGLLSIEIPKSSTLVTEGDGLYRLNGSYIYRGDVKDNYIMYSGLLFRILKINYGSNIEIILDNKINMLSYGKDVNYKDSDINNYLNDVFINSIDKDGLEKMEVCIDIKNDLADNKCKKTIKVYSTILDSNTYLSTINNGTYINDNTSLMYLRDRINNELGNVIANNNQISYIDGNESYDIKPIISLKYDTKIISGKGTKDDPYIVDQSESKLGSKIKLGDYNWVIIKEDKNYTTLALDGTLDTLKPFGEKFDVNDSNSIAYYLNNEFYDSLSFKSDIVETEFEVGNYLNNYHAIENETVKAKIGLLSIKDFKMDNLENQYMLINGTDDGKIYAVDSNMYTVDNNMSKAIRPVLRISNDKIEEMN